MSGPHDMAMIDRREAVRRVSLLLGGAVLVGESALWSACARPRDARKGPIGAFTAGDVELLDDIADTMLPETHTPGAKAAGVGPFMAMMVTDCYEEPDQRIFMDGLRQLDAASQRLNQAPFTAAALEARLAVLESLDREQKAYMDSKPPDAPAHYFRMMKELALLGYFTSEIGCTVAQRYTETPGRYDPCIPYTHGDRAWAPRA